jgi:hypothetical protein
MISRLSLSSMTSIVRSGGSFITFFAPQSNSYPKKESGPKPSNTMIAQKLPTTESWNLLISLNIKQGLSKQLEKLNPFALREAMEKRLKKILNPSPSSLSLQRSLR